MKAAFLVATALGVVGQALAGTKGADDAPHSRPMPGDHGEGELPTPPPMHSDPAHMGDGDEMMMMPQDEGHMHGHHGHHGHHHGDRDQDGHSHGGHGRGQMHCHMLPMLVAWRCPASL